MAGEWQRHEISQLISEGKLVIGDGYRAKNEEFAADGLPFARAGNINEGFHFDDADHFPKENLPRVGNKVSQPGDVVFTSKGTVGRFAFVRPTTPPFVYSPQLCFWRPVDQDLIDPRYLYYWMFDREFFVQFKGVAGQTDMAEYVSLTDQRRMHITLPKIHEQRVVAHILGSLDDKVELNRQMNETLEAMARALFKSWFVDFDPVRAKVEGRDPGLPADIAALSPDEFEDSELGEIPKGWSICALGNHVEVMKGLSYKGSGLADEGIPLHNLNSIYEGGCYKNGGLKHYTGEYKERHIVLPGDVIVANTEQGFDYLLIGYPAVVPQRYGDFGLFTHHTFRVRPLQSSYITTQFIYLLLLVPGFREQVISYTNGTTVNSLSREGLERPVFALPTSHMMQHFQATVAPLFALQETLYDESQTLVALRDTLLPKLISGQLRVG